MTQLAFNSTPVRTSTTPAYWPILLMTLLFGVFGIIPTLIQALRAPSTGRSAAKYWVAWFAMWIPCMLLWMLLLGQRA
jgi:hypothetical protein